MDGSGFANLFGRYVHEVVSLTHDRWALVDEDGLHLREVATQRERLLWPDLSGPIEPLNWGPDMPRHELLFGGTDPHGRNKKIYLARPDRLE